MSLAHLGQAIRANKSSGLPLKTVWQSLANAGVHFRRGQLCMIAAGSGVGKSVVALTLANGSGAKTVYHSADSGPGTQLARAVSIITGKEVREVRRLMEKGERFDKELQAVKHIRWDFEPAPTLEDLDKSMEAYAYLHGEYPELVVIDNLLNIRGDESPEGSRKTQEDILLFLKEIATNTGTCMVVLHHLMGAYVNGDKPPPLDALMNKVDKVIEMILTLWRVDQDTLGVNILKNREDVGQSWGGLDVELDLDLSRMLITDPVSHVNSPIPV